MKELSQIWLGIQRFLFPFLSDELGALTEKEKKLISILELARIEDHVKESRRWYGRPRKDRLAMARSFVAKSVYNLATTKQLIQYLHDCVNLRRICGFEREKDIPSEASFSRAFAEFAESALPQRVHEVLVQEHERERLVGHILRDSTAIQGREKPVKTEAKREAAAKVEKKRKRGRPRKGEQVEPKEPTRLERQQSMTLDEMLADLPSECDCGTKKNSKGYKESWTGFKLHIDSADGDIPISCILTSASVHDSQAALPLAEMTSQRVVNLYDLMDAAYDAEIIRQASLSREHVPIIDSNPRRGEKVVMDPAQAERYKNRSAAERVNSMLKESFGGNTVHVRGPKKVMAHLMFGILTIAAQQLLRLVQ